MWQGKEVVTLSDEQLKEAKDILWGMIDDRINKLNDLIAIERLKERKVIGKKHETCDKLKSLKEHQNPEFKALWDEVNNEIIRRKL